MTKEEALAAPHLASRHLPLGARVEARNMGNYLRSRGVNNSSHSRDRMGTMSDSKWETQRCQLQFLILTFRALHYEDI